jgi:uncharacterized Zn-finger protein
MAETETAAPRIKSACIDCPTCGRENALGPVCDDHNLPLLLQFISTPERATRCRYCRARFRLKDYDIEVRNKSAETLAALRAPFILQQ